MSGEQKINPTAKKNKIHVSKNLKTTIEIGETINNNLNQILQSDKSLDDELKQLQAKIHSNWNEPNSREKLKKILKQINLKRFEDILTPLIDGNDEIISELLKHTDNYLSYALVGNDFYNSTRSYLNESKELSKFVFSSRFFNKKAELIIEMFSLFCEQLSVSARKKFIIGFLIQVQAHAITRYTSYYSDHSTQESFHGFAQTLYKKFVVKFPDSFIDVPEELKFGLRGCLPIFLTLNAQEFEECVEKLTTQDRKMDLDLFMFNFQHKPFHFSILQDKFSGWDSERMLRGMMSNLKFVNSEYFVPTMTKYKDSVTNEIIRDMISKFSRQGVSETALIFFIKEVCGGINKINFDFISEVIQKDKISIEKFKQNDIDIKEYIFNNCHSIPARQIEPFLNNKSIQFPIEYKIQKYNSILLNSHHDSYDKSAQFMKTQLNNDPNFKMIDVVNNFLSRVNIEFIQKSKYFESIIWSDSVSYEEMLTYYQAAFDILDDSFQKIEIMSQFFYDRYNRDESISDEELTFFVKKMEEKNLGNYMDFFHQYYDESNQVPVQMYIHFTQSQVWKHIDSLFDFSANKYLPTSIKQAFICYTDEMEEFYISNSFYTKKFVDMTNNHPIHHLLDRMIDFYKIESVAPKKDSDNENMDVSVSLNKLLGYMKSYFGSMFLEQADKNNIFISQKIEILSSFMNINLNNKINDAKTMTKVKVRNFTDKIMFWKKEPEINQNYNYMYVYLQGPQFSNEILPEFVEDFTVENKSWKEQHEKELKIIFSMLKTFDIPVTISLKVQDISRKIKNFAESIYEIKDSLAYEDQMFFEFSFFKDLNDILKTYQNNSKNMAVLKNTFNNVSDEEIKKNHDNCLYLISLLEEQFKNISHNISSTLLQGGRFDMKVLEQYLISKKNQTQN